MSTIIDNKNEMVQLKTIFEIKNFEDGESLTLFKEDGVITIRRSEIKRPEITEDLFVTIDEARLMVKALNSLIEDCEQSGDAHDS